MKHYLTTDQLNKISVLSAPGKSVSFFHATESGFVPDFPMKEGERFIFDMDGNFLTTSLLEARKIWKENGQAQILMTWESHQHGPTASRNY